MGLGPVTGCKRSKVESLDTEGMAQLSCRVWWAQMGTNPPPGIWRRQRHLGELESSGEFDFQNKDSELLAGR